jgi:hypothetical protein
MSRGLDPEFDCTWEDDGSDIERDPDDDDQRDPDDDPNDDKRTAPDEPEGDGDYDPAVHPPLPPGNQRYMRANLRRVPHDWRAEAISEAWVSHLEGRDPAQAIDTFLHRERRHQSGRTGRDPDGPRVTTATDMNIQIEWVADDGYADNGQHREDRRHVVHKGFLAPPDGADGDDDADEAALYRGEKKLEKTT